MEQTMKKWTQALRRHMPSRQTAHRPARRVLASALAACLMLTLLPTAALAATTGQLSNLTAGETYYFWEDGSWKGYTYSGTINAYAMKSAQDTKDTVSAYEHSLFMANSTTDTLSFNQYGQDYTYGGVTYTRRLMSGGFVREDRPGSTGTSDDYYKYGNPTNNEWDVIGEQIGNSSMVSTRVQEQAYRSYRIYSGKWTWFRPNSSYNTAEYAPVLEVPASANLQGVTLNLQGGKLSGSNLTSIKTVLKLDSNTYTTPQFTAFTAPNSKQPFVTWNTQADGKGTNYAAGASVPASVTTLYAIYKPAAPTFQSTAVMLQGGSTTVSYTLTNKVENTTYTLYDSTGSNKVTSNPSMSVTDDTLTLTFTQAPSSNQTYYVSATDGDGYSGESEKTKITMSATRTDKPTFSSTVFKFEKASETSVATFTLTNKGSGYSYRVEKSGDSRTGSVPDVLIDGNTVTLTFSGLSLSRLRAGFPGNVTYKIYATDNTNGYAESEATSLILQVASQTATPVFQDGTVASPATFTLDAKRTGTLTLTNDNESSIEYEFKAYSKASGSLELLDWQLTKNGNTLTIVTGDYSPNKLLTYYITARDITNDKWVSKTTQFKVTRYPGAYAKLRTADTTAAVSFLSGDEDTATATDTVALSTYNASSGTTTFAASNFTVSSSAAEKTAIAGITVSAISSTSPSTSGTLTLQVAKSVNVPSFYLWYNNGTDDTYVGKVTLDKTIISPPDFESATAMFESAEASSVSFTLNTAPDDTTYKVYAQETGGEALTDPAVSVTDNTLTLTFTTKPTEETTYYISGTTGSQAESGRAAVTVKPYAAPTYTISLNPSADKTFASAQAGYGEQTAHSVTVNNTGNQATGALTVALSGTNSGSFTLSTASIDSIAVGGNSSFTVKPNTGLAAGTYTATVTVSGGNSISASFGVSFTVTAAPPAQTAPTITTTSLSGGTVGTAYSQTLAASGTTPITWSVSSGSLPAGLSLTGATISGSPTTAGTSTFTVKAENSAGNATKELSIVISAAPPVQTAPTITTTSLPGGTVGTAYSQTLAASGTTPITWSVTGSLPAGLNLNTSTGAISGSPTTAGTSTFTVKAENSAGNATKELSIAISAAPPAASTDATLSALTYTVSGGQAVNVPNFAAATESYNVALPYGTSQTAAITLTGTVNDSGASVTANEGVTLSNGTGTATITVTAEDSTTTKTYTVSFTIAEDTRSSAKQITGFTIANQVGNTAINQELHTIAVTMPSGTAVTSLTPTVTVSDKASVSPTSGTAQNFTNPVTYTVTAENGSTQTYTVTVTVQTAPPTQSSDATLSALTYTVSGGQAVNVPNFAAATESYNVELIYGTSPDTTITLTGTANDSSASITSNEGVTLSNGTGTATITVTAEDGTTKTYSVSFTIADPPSVGTAPSITTTSLPGGTVGEAYSQTLTADGDTPITWSVATGTLPAGLSLNGATISGNPTTAGTFNFTIKAENDAGNDTKQLSITIDEPEPTVTGVTVSPATTDVQKGTTQQFTATVTGENDPAQTVTWELDGSHADGTSISSAGLLTVASDETESTLTVKAASTVDGSVSGTATVTVTDQAVTRYTLTVTDGSGSGDYAQGAEITVTAETKAGQRFKEWTAEGVTLADATANPVTITMPGEAVTLTATYENIYAVTAQSDGNGTATASPAISAEGETVTISATANSGYQFKEWEIVSGTVNLGDASAAATTFTMPGEAVTIKAIFEPTGTPPVITYTVTFNPNGGTVTPTSGTTGAGGKLTSLPTPTRSGSYSFDGWYTAANGGDAVTTNTVFNSNTMIYAHWTYTGSSSSSGSGGGSNTTTSTTTNPDGSTTTTTTNKTTGTVTETTKAKDGTQTVVETKKDGTKTETVKKPDGTKTETITTPAGKVTETLERPDGVKTETVTAPGSTTTAEVTIPSGKGGATVTLPVQDTTPGTVAVIVHADGTEEIVKTSAATGDGLTVRLDNSATLKIVDNSKSFSDVSGSAWYADAVAFASSRELFQGTSATTFGPNEELTRGMLVTVLYRLMNEPAAGEADFTDVKDGAYYAQAIAWAAENGIVAGIGNGQYAPNCDITRQELAVMLYRFAGTLGLDTEIGSGSLQEFKDNGQVSGFAQDAMNWCVANGIISGKGNGVLDPKGNASRAQTSAMVMRFVSLMMK